MKKLSLSIFALAITLTTFGQAPEGFKYQAVVRDAGNLILNNQVVGMRLTIQQGSIGGTAFYTETFATTTNAYGLVNLEIGTGTTTDNFSIINWANGPYFIETAVDVTGGTSYVVMGTSQLMSVPYALYAKTSGSSTPGPQGPVGPAGLDGTSGTNGIDGAIGPQGPQGNVGATGSQGPQGNVGAQGPAGVGIAQTLSQTGNTVTLSDGGGSVNINDADANATNELQNIEQVLTIGDNANGKDLVNTGKIAIGTSTPATSAALDIASTTGAVLLPRMTTAQRDALTATPGMMVFNTNTGTIQGYHKQTLYDHPDQFDYEDWGSTPTSSSIAQAFVPSGDGQLRSVVVLYEAFGGDPGNLIIHDGAGIGGTIIANQPISIPSGSSGMTMEFALNTPVQLIGGNTYTFEIQSWGAIRFRSSPSFTYLWGDAYYDGAASGNDLYFITKMDVTSNVTKWNDL